MNGNKRPGLGLCLIGFVCCGVLFLFGIAILQWTEINDLNSRLPAAPVITSSETSSSTPEPITAGAITAPVAAAAEAVGVGNAYAAFQAAARKADLASKKQQIAQVPNDGSEVIADETITILGFDDDDLAPVNAEETSDDAGIPILVGDSSLASSSDGGSSSASSSDDDAAIPSPTTATKQTDTIIAKRNVKLLQPKQKGKIYLARGTIETTKSVPKPTAAAVKVEPTVAKKVVGATKPAPATKKPATATQKPLVTKQQQKAAPESKVMSMAERLKLQKEKKN